MAALIFAAFPVGQLITALGGVGFVERAGRRPAMILAAVLLAAATLAFALSVGVATLALARLVQGLAAGLVWTAGLAAISDITPVDQLGFRMGLAETAGGGFGLIGPLVGGALIDTVGTDAAFALGAILPAIAVVPALAMPETRRRHPPSCRGWCRRCAGWRWCRRPAWPSGRSAASPPCSRWWSRCCRSNLAHRLDLSSLGIGLVFSAGLVAYFALVPLAGWVSDKRGRRAPLLAGGGLMAAGLPLMGVGPPVVVALAFAAVGAGMACMGAPSGPLLVEAVDEAGMAGRYGLSSAVMTVVFALGYALGPVLGAGSSAVLPFTATMVIAAAAVALVALWVARALPAEHARRTGLAPGPRGADGGPC